MMLEFAVASNGTDHEKYFPTWDEACVYAVGLAASGYPNVTIDAIVGDEEGAIAYGGSSGLELYLDNPNASVFERFEISVNCVGKIS